MSIIKAVEKNMVIMLALQSKPPKEPGYYWYATRGGEHTPAMLKVELDKGILYASAEEFWFKVNPKPNKKVLWARIPDPMIDGERVEPGSW